MRDPLTGLNSLGARYYDAGLARFISVDPASNQASAQAANAYAYGNNNPVVFTDPTGLWGWSSITHAVSSAASWVVEHKQQIASVAVGIAVGVAVCATGIGCAAELTFAAAGALAASGAASGVASYGFDVATGAVKNPSVGGVLKAAGFGAAGSVLTLGAGKFVGAALCRPAAALVGSDSALARVTGKTLQRLDVPIGGKSGAGKGDPVPSGPKQEPGTSATGGGDTGGSGSSPGGKRAPISCALNSFGAGTLVRMAGGTVTPIDKIRTGDVVVSVDPKTGRDVTGTVTAAYVNQDHQFTDLEFTAADGGTASLHTTSHHRIWDQTRHAFANATDLKAGHQIHTTDGQTWKLTSKHTWRGSQRMYDITVGSVHTFYVLAGPVPILVHNCGDDAVDGAASTAERVADAALAGGKTRGAASALRLPDGGPGVVDVSGSERVINPAMQGALDSIPQDVRPGFHGWCSEIGCMNQALNEGRSLVGGTMRTVAIGDTSPGHSLAKAPCPTCAGVMRRFGVNTQ